MTTQLRPDEPTTAPTARDGEPLVSVRAQGDAVAGTGRRREFGRLVRFGVVGVVNTVITLAAFALLDTLGTPGPVASALAFLAGAVNSYLVNRRWTFADLESAPAAGARFLAIQCLGAALSAGGEAALQAAGAAHMVAECAVVPCVTVALYGLARTYVFRGDPGSDPT